MAATLTIHDETPLGDKTNAVTLNFLYEVITVRELIRERVYSEVQQFNTAKSDYFQGLVQPKDAERTLNGFRVRTGQQVDFEAQYQKALEAFERNGFFILVDDKQVESLEESITLTPQTQISFVKLVPLVGG